MLLSQEERKMIHDYIYNYATNEDTNFEREADLSYILRFWQNAKEEFLLKTFNNQLILEKEIDYLLPIEDLEDKFDFKIYNSNGRKFYSKLFGLCWTTPGLQEYENYLITYESILKNKWTGPDDVELPLPNNKKFKVNRSTKMTRILGKLAKTYNLPYWEDVRQAHAEVLTLQHTKGTLCLSIHPLDYMTMSDNEEGWESCMSWQNHGCYRGGTVEMMNSPYVIVAYLKSDRTMDNGWNSKAWRELYIVNKDLICNIRAYPYINEELSKQVLNWLRELCKKNCGFAYDDAMRAIDKETKMVENLNLRLFFIPTQCIMIVIATLNSVILVQIYWQNRKSILLIIAAFATV